jgi:hypothetical protein
MIREISPFCIRVAIYSPSELLTLLFCSNDTASTDVVHYTDNDSYTVWNMI